MYQIKEMIFSGLVQNQLIEPYKYVLTASVQTKAFSMITLTTLLTIAVASFLLAIVPGPTVTVIVANSLRGGTKAGFLNIAGTFVADVVLVIILAFGLKAVIGFVGEAFFWIKMIGAAYLMWIGLKLLMSDGDIGTAGEVKPPRMGYFWQGFFVLLANPKALFFLGAFIPQFVDPTGDTFSQTLILGLTFAVVASLSDCIYAVLAGKAGTMLTQSRVRIAEVFGGVSLIGGGIWLALARRV